MGKTYQENYNKIGNLLVLSSAVTFTLGFWSYDDIYMLNRIEKNWQVVWREGNCNYETAPDALEMQIQLCHQLLSEVIFIAQHLICKRKSLFYDLMRGKKKRTTALIQL